MDISIVILTTYYENACIVHVTDVHVRFCDDPGMLKN